MMDDTNSASGEDHVPEVLTAAHPVMSLHRWKQQSLRFKVLDVATAAFERL